MSELTASQAVSLLERRRMQNRLSQQRYRDRARLARQQARLSPEAPEPTLRNGRASLHNKGKGRSGSNSHELNGRRRNSTVPWSATMLLTDPPEDESPLASSSSSSSSSSGSCFSTDAASARSTDSSSLLLPDTPVSPTIDGSSSSSQEARRRAAAASKPGNNRTLIQRQSPAREPFYLHLSRMLMDPAEIDETQTVVPPPTLDLALTMRARAAMDLIPAMGEAFGIPLRFLTDKRAMIEPSHPWWPPAATSGNERGGQRGSSSRENAGNVVVVYYTSSTGQGLLQLNWEGKPSNMTPTWLQRNRRHQMGLSVIFPWPSVRDRMIEEVEKQDMRGTICQDLAYGASGQDDPDDEWQPSFTIWGEDLFDPLSWEVGKAFLLKYPHMFDAQVLAQTNWWRRKRGKAPIVP